MSPEIVGRYELIEPLGSGGMGEVFLATDTMLQRRVAVKRVHAGDARAAKYILHEARIVANLDHPNIATVYDVVEHDGLPHVVMELVSGSTLADLARGAPLAEDMAVHYGRQIADALAYAHRSGVLHNDLKPANIMITAGGVVKVLDFGIARRADHDGTTTESIKGTPPYMAPEVLFGSPPSPLSDVFSLGVLLYELIAGRRPYDGRGAAALLTAMTAPAPALDASVAGVSRELSAIVARAIHTDATQRLASADEFKRALDRIAPATTTTVSAPPRPASRAKTTALLGAFAVVCAALVAGVPRLAPNMMSSQRPVLGVMIFNNSGQAENDYLAAGMADVLVSQLAGSKDVTVVPRTAMATLSSEGQVPAAVKDLGLTHVLTGSVQRSGNTLRMAINLIADRGRSLKWSQTFDGTLGDVFHLEQRIGQAALQALRGQGVISAQTVAEARERIPADAAAFEDYAHGRALLDRVDVPGNADRALQFFERAVQRDPSFARAHAAIGEVAWWKYNDTRDTEWIDRARAALLNALRLAPDDARVAITLAMVDHGTGRSDDAIAGLEKVIAAAPNHDAHRFLGRVYSERGDFDKAIEEFREAEALRPEYPATIRDLGLAYYDRGRLDEAIATFSRLTAMQPDNASAHQTLGTALHAASELDRALVSYRRAIALAPRPSAYSNIGTIHYARREYGPAIEAYRRAIALQPKEATTHRNLADSLWYQGRRDEARQSYERAIALAAEALKVNPAAVRQQSLTAYCEAKLGRVEQARQRIAAAVAAAPEDSDAAYKQAVIEAIGGNADQALRYLERALTLGYSRALFNTDRDLDSLRSRPEFAGLSSR